MNTTDTNFTALLTGAEATDNMLRAAYELGLRNGRASDRDNLKRSAEIETTKRLLTALMSAQRIDLTTAMIALAIPKKERKTYIKIFAEKARQRMNR